MGFKVSDFCIFEGKGHFTSLSGQVCQIEALGDPEPRFKVAFKNGNTLWAFTEWLQPVATVTEPPTDAIRSALPSGCIEFTPVSAPMPWRLEIASRVLQGLSSDSIAKARLSEFLKNDTKKIQETFAEVSLEQADILLKLFYESTPKKTPDIKTFHGVGFEEERESEYDLHTKGAKVPRFEI